MGHSKVIGTDTDRYVIHDFLLTFHNNHVPILHRFRDKRWIQSKIVNFSHPCVFCAPLTEFPLEFGISSRGEKNRMMGLLEGLKSFKIDLAV